MNFFSCCFAFILSLPEITVHPISFGMVMGLLALIGLLISSSLISGSEVAYFSLNPNDIKRMRESNSSSNRVAMGLVERSEQLLATILITNNLINVGIIILSAFLTASVVDFSNAPLLGFVIQVVAITFILLLFGEIMPKILAASHSYSFACLMAFPLYVLSKVFHPLNYLLVRSTAPVNRLNTKKNISIDDLNEALDITTGQHPEEKKILKGIVTFGSTEVREIMKPRLDVIALDYPTGFNKLKMVVVESGYSRIPIYMNSFDEIKGVLYVKDLLPHIHEGDDFEWQGLIRDPYFVPENKKINVLLSEFQSDRIHMAIVVDEYGGTCGIVSLEDILEEIVGDISDESDDEVALFTKLDERNFLFEAKILLNDFYRVLGVKDEVFEKVRGEAETLAGLILEITSLLPQKNEVIEYGKFRFLIDAVDNKRIKRVKVTLK